MRPTGPGGSPVAATERLGVAVPRGPPARHRVCYAVRVDDATRGPRRGGSRRCEIRGGRELHPAGWELFRLMLDVASGRRRTWAEQWRLHNALVLFNPAPVT